MKNTFIECDNCAHCIDLSGSQPTDDPALTAARNDGKAAIIQWLKDEKEEMKKS